MKNRRGYTLVEAVIAGAILLVGIAAAALLANSVVLTQIGNERGARAINAQDQAARLYQLGLEPTTITNILPPNCTTNSPTHEELAMFFSTGSITFGPTTAESATNIMVYRAGEDTGANPTYRTNTVIIIRVSTR